MHLVKNLKYLIWADKKSLPKLTYSEYLDFAAAQCGMLPERFRDILRNDAIATGREEYQIKTHYEDLGYDLTAIRDTDLFSETPDYMQFELLRENLMYLLRKIPRGGNAEVVKAVDIDPSTLSRWKKGLTIPDKYHLRLICEYFHMAEDSLRTEFLFLDLEPVTTQSKKNLCKEWIDQMSPEEFDALFPALKKLIK